MSLQQQGFRVGLVLSIAVLTAGGASGESRFNDFSWAERDSLGHAHEHQILVYEEVATFADGATRGVGPIYLVKGPDGFYEPKISPSAAGELSVRNTLHWPPGAKINFFITQYIKREKHNRAMKKGLAKDTTRERATSKVPKQRVTGKTVPVRDISTFPNAGDYYFQHFANGQNNLIMTEDDQMFSFPPPNQNQRIDDRIAFVRRLGSGTCVRTGGTILCNFCNVEADYLFRSDFFDRSTIDARMLLAFGFRQTLGLNNSLSTNDLTGQRRPYLTEETFLDRSSAIWQEDRARQTLRYPSGFRNKSLKAQMTPLPGTVIDFSGDLQPDAEVIDLRTFRPEVFEVNLHGAKPPTGPNGTLTATFYRIERTTNAQGQEVVRRVKIATARGQTEDYEVELLGTNETGRPVLYLSHVGFAVGAAAANAIDKIREAIAEHGRPMTIRGVSWNRALEARIEVVGRETDVGGLASTAGAFKGPRRKVAQNYYFVNMDEEVPF